MLGTTGRNKELEGTLGNHLDQSSHVQAVVNYYGPSALLQMNDHPSKIDHNAPGSPESQLIGAPIQQSKKKASYASRRIGFREILLLPYASEIPGSS